MLSIWTRHFFFFFFSSGKDLTMDSFYPDLSHVSEIAHYVENGIDFAITGLNLMTKVV